MNEDPKQVTHFKWYAVATAPRGYPMEVISGNFFYKGQDVGPLIPSGGTLTTGWGKSASVYSGGPENPPLPDRVKITFYSYTEKQVYRGEFKLPYESILEKFQQRNQEKPDENYSKFLVGVAPGGTVSVWIAGTRTVEVFFGQAEKIEMTPTAAFRLPFESKEDSDGYVELAMAESVTPEQLQIIKTKGAPIDMWARYRNLYKWAPAYKDGKSPPKPTMPTQFLNGESDWIPTVFSQELAATPKPLPLQLKFRAHVTKDESAYYIIDFEPVELMEAFEKLGAHGEKVYIEFDPQIPVTNTRIRVYNDVPPKDSHTPKEFIELKKFKVDP